MLPNVHNVACRCTFSPCGARDGDTAQEYTHPSVAINARPTIATLTKVWAPTKVRAKHTSLIRGICVELGMWRCGLELAKPKERRASMPQRDSRPGSVNQARLADMDEQWHRLAGVERARLSPPRDHPQRPAPVPSVFVQHHGDPKLFGRVVGC